MVRRSRAVTRPEPGIQAQATTKLVTHADHALGRRVATRLLCGGERVRAHVSAYHPGRTGRLEKAGAEIICSDYQLGGNPERWPELWHGIGSVIHASASGTSRGREAVVSVSDLGVEAMLQTAQAAQVSGFVLLHPPTLELHSRLKRSALPYTLFCPETQALAVTLSGGAHGRLLERRRLVVFMPLLRVVDALVFAASGGFERMTLHLPTVTRRYSQVVDDLEQLVSLPESAVADALLAELIMGSPYKLVTPGVARALGLTFPKRYLEQIFSPPEA